VELYSRIRYLHRGRYYLDDLSITLIKTSKTRGKEEYTQTLHIRIPGKKWLELKPKTDKRILGNKTLAEIIYRHRRKIMRWLLND
jgi:hypothetical protein